jgi:hypothetical protein
MCTHNLTINATYQRKASLKLENENGASAWTAKLQKAKLQNLKTTDANAGAFGIGIDTLSNDCY